jgi:agmatinase
MYLLKNYPPFLAAEFPKSGDSSLFHVLPVPLEREALSSLPGKTRKGPSAILKASGKLEVFDGKGIPAEVGIQTLPPVDCRGRIEDILNDIADQVEDIFEQEKIPVLLGGEHTLSNGAFLAILRQIEEGAVNVGIVQIDAHADLRERGEGTIYSRFCVMKRALDMGFPIYQMGVRSLSPGEMDLRKERNIPYRDASELCAGSGVKEITLSPDFPEYIYLTIDVDGLDPSVIPGTSYPEPGGLQWYQTLNLVESLAARYRIIGFDIVETAPGRDDTISAYAAARLTYQIMGIISRHINE